MALDSRPTEGAPCQDLLEQWVLTPSLASQPDDEVAVKVLNTKIFEQSVLGEGPIVRPETAVTSERHHEQTCFKLSARPTPDSGFTDVRTDIHTDRSDNSAPGNTSEIFEQSVLREGSIVRPETAVMSETPSRTDMFKICRRGRRRRLS